MPSVRAAAAVALITATLTLGATVRASAQEFEWVPVTPFPRVGHSTVYDPGHDRILVFGGRSLPQGWIFSDVWEYSFGPDPGWKLLEPLGTHPAARADHTAIYDTDSDRMIVFGGHAADLDDRM